MGIDFSHCNAHWAYSGFMGFRNRLMESMGYGGDGKHLREMYSTGAYFCMENEPLWPLINHSDCDGQLSVEEMKQILPQLKGIVAEWGENDYDAVRAGELIEGMETAIECDEPLEFS